MKTPVVGLTNKELVANRTAYIDFIKGCNDEQLLQANQHLTNQIEKAESSYLKGTSEYNWRYGIIKEEIKQRGLALEV